MGRCKHDQCELCGAPSNGKVHCTSCLDRLTFLAQNQDLADFVDFHLRVSGRTVVISDLVVASSARESNAVLFIDMSGQPGVRFPLMTEGSCKCLICGEFSDGAVCNECMEGVIAARSMKRIAPALLEVAGDPEMLRLLQFVLEQIGRESAEVIVKSVLKEAD